jgi:hypothetical protein
MDDGITNAGERQLEERFLSCRVKRAVNFLPWHEMHRLAKPCVSRSAGDAETRRYMRVLHEEVLSRIAGIHRR